MVQLRSEHVHTLTDRLENLIDVAVVGNSLKRDICDRVGSAVV